MPKVLPQIIIFVLMNLLELNNPEAMEPMRPDEEVYKRLEALSLRLVKDYGELTGGVHDNVESAIAPLVRSMNTYYTNKIEGYDTFPIDIERALTGNYSPDPEKKNLQLLAKAHVETYTAMMASIKDKDPNYVFTDGFFRWLHAAFYEKLPLEMRLNKKLGSEETVETLPGKFRNTAVIVQNHIPPLAEVIPAFMSKLENAYKYALTNESLLLKRIIDIGAAHHRFLFIHPFADGNGRVARLFSDACFAKAGLNKHGLWFISRGLARNRNEYYAHLHNADQKRYNDYDGRGNLSMKGLEDFCSFFLKTAIEQVGFMKTMLEPTGLLDRAKGFCDRMVANDELPKEAFYIFEIALLKGYVPKKDVERFTGKSENTARKIARALVDKGLLLPGDKLDPYKIAFPTRYTPYFFPNLYPPDVEARMGL